MGNKTNPVCRRAASPLFNGERRAILCPKKSKQNYFALVYLNQIYQKRGNKNA